MKKKHLPLKIAGVILGVFLIAAAGIFLGIAHHPKIVVDLIQSAIYTDGAEVNSWEPKAQPARTVKDSGMMYVNDFKYGDTYPNSYLDITYPTEDTSIRRPTIVYFHGGGYFGGDKAMGDPLAESDNSSYLYDRFVQEGYNFVNVNYALVPECYFPIPIIQMNEAINYLYENADELGLDMHDVTLFGQSAGAVMVSQYGAILSNTDYAAVYTLTAEPKLALTDIRGLVIDDAPLNMLDKEAGIGIKVLMANYLEDSIFFRNREKHDQYNSMNWLTPEYPRSFVTAGTDDGCPYDMKNFEELLTGLGVECINFETQAEQYGLTKHGYLSNLENDESGAAQDCFDAIIDFLKCV